MLLRLVSARATKSVRKRRDERVSRLIKPFDMMTSTSGSAGSLADEFGCLKSNRRSGRLRALAPRSAILIAPFRPNRRDVAYAGPKETVLIRVCWPRRFRLNILQGEIFCPSFRTIRLIRRIKRPKFLSRDFLHPANTITYQ